MRRALRIARISLSEPNQYTTLSQISRSTTTCIPVQTVSNPHQNLGRRNLPCNSGSSRIPESNRGYATDSTSEPKLLSDTADPLPPTSSNLPSSTDLLEVYRGMVAQGRLRWDEEQVRVVMKLKHLLEELSDYEPPLDLLAQIPSSPLSTEQRQSRWRVAKKEKEDHAWIRGLDFDKERGKELIRVLSGEESLAELKTPKGILLTGPPGTGKSLLLNLFFQLLPTSHKHRAHYHSFTLSLFRRAFLEMEARRGAITPEHQKERMDLAGKRGWRAVFAGGRFEGEAGTDKGENGETIPFAIARDMIMEYHILYFDELQLLDASSAALLRDVLSWYWRLGGVIVSCSNRVPDDLYHHGVQRERMSSFLDALKARCEVVELDGGRDWRSGVEGEEKLFPKWYDSQDSAFDEAWNGAVGDQRAGPSQLSVYGRRLPVPRAAGTAARFTFQELCEEPLGPADYLAITSTYSTIFIDAVPILLLKHKNEARRLINLVDAMYEARCQVFVRAAAPLTDIFFPDALDLPGTGAGHETNESIMTAEMLSETLQAPSRPNVSLYNPLMGDKREKADREHRGSVWAKTGIFTGDDERFAYKRAVSRLVEMTTSIAYAKEEWIPLDISARVWDNRRSPHMSSNSNTSTPLASRTSNSSQIVADDDFASEAGYSRPEKLTPHIELSTRNTSRKDGIEERLIEHADGTMKRMTPPQIKEQHVWGVAEEWGDKAGKWGQGAKAFGKGKKGSEE